jgi:hypothetical protein
MSGTKTEKPFRKDPVAIGLAVLIVGGVTLLLPIKICEKFQRAAAHLISHREPPQETLGEQLDQIKAFLSHKSDDRFRPQAPAPGP